MLALDSHISRGWYEFSSSLRVVDVVTLRLRRGEHIIGGLRCSLGIECESVRRRLLLLMVLLLMTMMMLALLILSCCV